MLEVCSQCGGDGVILRIDSEGRRAVRVCDCQNTVRSVHRVSASKIPPRYQHCSLESFDTAFPGADPSLQRALMMVQGFIRDYPFATDGRGLIFTGSIGVGKTHLAVGTLKMLVEDRGARALFCDYRELLKQIQHSYNPQVHTTELDVLKPVFDAEVLVLDELGAQKPTDWVWDTVALILNARYNDKKTTIITSNYPDMPVAGLNLTSAQQSARAETLGDRIGERMRSRLAEMCAPIEMAGPDFRRIKRASFAMAL